MHYFDSVCNRNFRFLFNIYKKIICELYIITNRKTAKSEDSRNFISGVLSDWRQTHAPQKCNSASTFMSKYKIQYKGSGEPQTASPEAFLLTSSPTPQRTICTPIGAVSSSACVFHRLTSCSQILWLQDARTPESCNLGSPLQKGVIWQTYGLAHIN